jgi:hypothetical protein
MRPLPYPIVEPRGVARAVEAETRTRTGEPGPKYWQQYSRYRISAEYAPATGRLDGQVTITYINRSPNRIPNVFLHLYHNLFAENAMRNRTVPITGGVTVSRMAIGGQAVQPFAQANPRGYRINGTIMGGAYPDVDRANNVWPAK